MIPYIQNRTGNVFEFVGTMKQKRDYEKELQREIQKEMFSNLTNEELQLLEDTKNANNELFVKQITRKGMANIDIASINEKINLKYIKIMLSNKYALTDNELSVLIEELYEDYGDEAINERFAKIIEVVFTQLGNNVNYKELPAWGIE